MSDTGGRGADDAPRPADPLTEALARALDATWEERTNHHADVDADAALIAAALDAARAPRPEPTLTAAEDARVTDRVKDAERAYARPEPMRFSDDAADRLQAILDSGRWPSGAEVLPYERPVIERNIAAHDTPEEDPDVECSVCGLTRDEDIHESIAHDDLHDFRPINDTPEPMRFDDEGTYLDPKYPPTGGEQ